jgi:hypothetical protein
VQDWLLGGHVDLLLQVFALSKAAVLRRLRLRLPTLPTERLQAVLTQVGGVALALWQHGP